MNKDLWDAQESFTRKFWATRGGMPDPKDEKQITAVTKDYALHLVSEITEVVGELSWRMHRLPNKVVDRDNVIEELVDVAKFTLGLIQCWGFSYEQFADEFHRKSMVVNQRFDQERYFANLAHELVAIVDIDGVLADWDSSFYAFIAKGHASSIASARKWFRESSIVTQEDIKTMFRRSGEKATMPVLPGAKEFLGLLRSGGLKIVLLTNRPYAEQWRIYPDTLAWLELEHLPYDALLWSVDKGFDAVKNFSNICFAVDDRDKNIRRLIEAKIPTIKVDPHDETRNTAALLQFARGVGKLEDLAFAWNDRAGVGS